MAVLVYPNSALPSRGYTAPSVLLTFLCSHILALSEQSQCQMNVHIPLPFLFPEGKTMYLPFAKSKTCALLITKDHLSQKSCISPPSRNLSHKQGKPFIYFKYHTALSQVLVQNERSAMLKCHLRHLQKQELTAEIEICSLHNTFKNCSVCWFLFWIKRLCCLTVLLFFGHFLFFFNRCDDTLSV